jgi:hypothetical protein
MIVARLIDHEGVTVANMALDDPPDRPRWYVYSAVCPKITALKVAENIGPDSVHGLKTIEYRLERRDGGGTYIYRRVTPLWG